MPSQRCPDCGRFLPRGFVASLAERSAPCPRCGVALDGTRLTTNAPAPAAPTAPTAAAGTPEPAKVPVPVPIEALAAAPDDGAEVGPDEPGDRSTEHGAEVGPDEPGDRSTEHAAEVGPDEASVRPPDLAPDTVRDDVLAGWDVGVGPADMARWREDHRPFPTDTVVVAGAAAGGLVLGAVLDDRPGRGAAVGTVAGAIAGAAARRIWRLEP